MHQGPKIKKNSSISKFYQPLDFKTMWFLITGMPSSITNKKISWARQIKYEHFQAHRDSLIHMAMAMEQVRIVDTDTIRTRLQLVN